MADQALDQALDRVSDEPTVGGPCQYVDHRGTATIVAIEAPPSRAYSCPNEGVRVVFDFEPSDPAARAAYRFPRTLDKRQTWTIGSGMNPPRSCLHLVGARVGARVPAVRREIVEGTCTPILFDLGLDEKPCVDRCWKPHP